MEMTEGAKHRLSVVVGVVKTVFHYGFIPTVLYLGKFQFNHYPWFSLLGNVLLHHYF